jgi:type IV pilus assembly protein PilX
MLTSPVFVKAQSGIVLVVALIMLLLLTLIATIGMQNSSLEEKMAGNMRNQNLVLQAAESALRAAEATLVPVAPAVLPAFDAVGTGGFYSEATPASVLTDAALVKDSFWTNSSRVATSTVTGASLGNGIETPKYIIQKLDAACYDVPSPCAAGVMKTPYRVTVRATGETSNTVVILQSVFTP